MYKKGDLVNSEKCLVRYEPTNIKEPISLQFAKQILREHGEGWLAKHNFVACQMPTIKQQQKYGTGLLNVWARVAAAMVREYDFFSGNITGVAIYPTTYQHSCHANCIAVYQRDVVKIYATRTIEKDERLTLSKIPTIGLWSRPERHLQLRAICTCDCCKQQPNIPGPILDQVKRAEAATLSRLKEWDPDDLKRFQVLDRLIVGYMNQSKYEKAWPYLWQQWQTYLEPIRQKPTARFILLRYIDRIIRCMSNMSHTLWEPLLFTLEQINTILSVVFQPIFAEPYIPDIVRCRLVTAWLVCAIALQPLRTDQAQAKHQIRCLRDTFKKLPIPDLAICSLVNPDHPFYAFLFHV